MTNSLLIYLCVVQWATLAFVYIVEEQKLVTPAAVRVKCADEFCFKSNIPNDALPIPNQYTKPNDRLLES